MSQRIQLFGISEDIRRVIGGNKGDSLIRKLGTPSFGDLEFLLEKPFECSRSESADDFGFDYGDLLLK